MPQLKNARHERMAQGLADGKSQAQAYRDAGFTSKAPRKDASALLRRKPDIFRRRDEILSERAWVHEEGLREAIRKVGYTKVQVLEALGEIVERCMQSYPVLDQKGNHVYVEKPDGRIAPAYTFDARGATAALRLLGLELGMFVQRYGAAESPLDDLPPEMVRLLHEQLRIVVGKEVSLAARDPTAKGKK